MRKSFRSGRDGMSLVFKTLQPEKDVILSKMPRSSYRLQTVFQKEDYKAICVCVRREAQDRCGRFYFSDKVGQKGPGNLGGV